MISKELWRPVTFLAPNYTDHNVVGVVVGLGEGEALGDGAVRMLSSRLEGVHVQTGREL